MVLKTDDMLDQPTAAALALCCVHMHEELKIEHHRNQRQKIEFLRQAYKEVRAANRRLQAEAAQLGLKLQASRGQEESHVRALMAIQQLAEQAHMCALPSPPPGAIHGRLHRALCSSQSRDQSDA